MSVATESSYRLNQPDIEPSHLLSSALAPLLFNQFQKTFNPHHSFFKMQDQPNKQIRQATYYQLPFSRMA